MCGQIAAPAHFHAGGLADAAAMGHGEEIAVCGNATQAQVAGIFNAHIAAGQLHAASELIPRMAQADVTAGAEAAVARHPQRHALVNVALAIYLQAAGRHGAQLHALTGQPCQAAGLHIGLVEQAQRGQDHIGAAHLQAAAEVVACMVEHYVAGGLELTAIAQGNGTALGDAPGEGRGIEPAHVGAGQCQRCAVQIGQARHLRIAQRQQAQRGGLQSIHVYLCQRQSLVGVEAGLCGLQGHIALEAVVDVPQGDVTGGAQVGRAVNGHLCLLLDAAAAGQVQVTARSHHAQREVARRQAHVPPGQAGHAGEPVVGVFQQQVALPGARQRGARLDAAALLFDIVAGGDQRQAVGGDVAADADALHAGDRHLAASERGGRAHLSSTGQKTQQVGAGVDCRAPQVDIPGGHQLHGTVVAVAHAFYIQVAVRPEQDGLALGRNHAIERVAHAVQLHVATGHQVAASLHVYKTALQQVACVGRGAQVACGLHSGQGETTGAVDADVMAGQLHASSECVVHVVQHHIARGVESGGTRHRQRIALGDAGAALHLQAVRLYGTQVHAAPAEPGYARRRDGAKIQCAVGTEGDVAAFGADRPSELIGAIAQHDVARCGPVAGTVDVDGAGLADVAARGGDRAGLAQCHAIQPHRIAGQGRGLRHGGITQGEQGSGACLQRCCVYAG